MPSTVFKDYDQQGLDAQLNLRARWPDHEDYFQRWSEASQVARRNLDCQLDLAYGPTASEKMDFFPAATPNAPLFVFIHGGYWQGRDKAEFCFPSVGFVEAGISFASLNYALAPAVTIEDMVGQIRRALAWLYKRATELGADPMRIYVCGHSAGGHLATMAAITDWRAVDPELPDQILCGAGSISGLYDLEPVRLSYHNEILGLDAAMARRMSPIDALPSRAAPLLCAVGALETDEFLRQQTEFADAWRSAGLPLRLVDMPGHTHFTIVDAMAEAGNPLFDALCAAVLEVAPAAV